MQRDESVVDEALPHPARQSEFDWIFMVGAPRSGSTWLQLMLGSHPHIVTGQESQVFSEYVAPLHERWRRELTYPDSELVRQHGIAPYLSEAEFLGLLRGFVRGVVRGSVRQKPEAHYFLEKSPSSTFHIPLIHRCFPETAFIHIVRDGRDVAASLLHAAQSWGRDWAPGNMREAARLWSESVRAARGAALLTERFIEVRYEDLLLNTTAELERLAAFLGITWSSTELERVKNTFRFEKLSLQRHSADVFKNTGARHASGTSERREPPGFFGKGKAGRWQESLTQRQLEVFDWVAGELLVELGYTSPAERHGSGWLPRLEVSLEETLQSCKQRLKAGLVARPPSTPRTTPQPSVGAQPDAAGVATRSQASCSL